MRHPLVALARRRGRSLFLVSIRYHLGMNNTHWVCHIWMAPTLSVFRRPMQFIRGLQTFWCNAILWLFAGPWRILRTVCCGRFHSYMHCGLRLASIPLTHVRGAQRDPRGKQVVRIAQEALNLYPEVTDLSSGPLNANLRGSISMHKQPRGRKVPPVLVRNWLPS